MDAPGTAILYSWGRTGFEHMYCKHVLFPLLSGLFSFYQDCFWVDFSQYTIQYS